MRVQPDAEEAVTDRSALLERMRAVLVRAGLDVPPDARMRHPAVVEVVHRVQQELRTGPLTAERLRTAAAGFDRLPPSGCAPAFPRGHLQRSVARALRSLPARTRPDGEPVTAEVAEWVTRERDVLARSLEMLDDIWPQSADETRETVAEVALLDGDAIDGYTDFTIHGAVLLNRTRLMTSREGLPGVVRCAEALVREGTHTRCDAAASRTPFLLPEGGGGADAGEAAEGAPGGDRPRGDGPGSGSPRSGGDRSGSPRSGGDRSGGGAEVGVLMPLRAEPGPLTGLFQQAVVLSRSVLFYRRLVEGGLAGGGPAVAARHALLLKAGRQAVWTLSTHTAALTEEGARVVDECAGILRCAGWRPGRPADH